MKTVLIVEDLAELRDVLKRVLAANGYQVLTAVDAQDALSQAAAAPAPIDILLTDWRLPGLSGRELALQLAATRPHLRVLLSSGKVDLAVDDLKWLEPLGEYLPKPYDLPAMLEAIQRLDAQGSR